MNAILALSFVVCTISNADFVAQISAGVNALHEQNPKIELLGSGTALLLDSHRESKVKCGHLNPDPKPGECSGAYPIYPEQKPLTELVKSEAKTNVEAKATKAAWVAWIDCDGKINVAFNQLAGNRELSAADEVADNGGWSGLGIYYISGTPRQGGKASVWIKDSEKASFTWYRLGTGKAEDLAQRLKALADLHVIRDLKVSK